MDTLLWGGIVLAALISLLAVLFVIWPLLQPGPTLPLVDNDRLADLLVRKDTLLRAIKDLEFDHQMGKIADEDYTRFAARLRRQALGIIGQIDKIAPESTTRDAQLEAEIARLRKVYSSAEKPPSGPATPPTLAPETGIDATGKYCTQCGKAIGADHKFCAACGAPIGAVARY